MPRLSILLPVRDGAATIGRAITSIRRQTESDWELLVVDDGSVDETAERVRAAAGGDPRIRIFPNPGRGLVDALTVGIAESKAPLLARMDADDRAFPDRLQRQCDAMDAETDLGLVACRVEQPGGGAGYRRHAEWTNTILSPRDHRLNRFVESPVAHPSVVFRRSLVDDHGGYRDGDFPEDYELWLRWLAAGGRFRKLDRVLLEWRDSPDRLSRTDPRYRPEAFHRLKCEYLAAWIRGSLDEGRPLWLWGAGRITRRRFRLLEETAGRFAGFVDIDPRKTGNRIEGRPVVDPTELGEPDGRFLVLGVASTGARERAAGFLEARGFRIGRDYIPGG